MCDDKICWFTNKTKIVLNKMTLKVTINQVVYLKSYLYMYLIIITENVKVLMAIHHV